MTASGTVSSKDVKSSWLGRVCLAAVVSSALTWALAARGIEADYVGTGLLLASTNYGLLLPLLGFGAAASELEGLLIVEALALFTAGLATSAALSENLLLENQDALSFIVRYPVTNSAIAFAAGICLLAGRKWRGIPFAIAALVLGGSFGTTIGLYSPGDDRSLWFVAPAALAGFTLVLLAAYATSKVRAPWWAIARRICGSWLIATAVLLAGFPLVPKKELPEATSAEPLPQKSIAGSDAIERPTSPPTPAIPDVAPMREP